MLPAVLLVDIIEAKLTIDSFAPGICKFSVAISGVLSITHIFASNKSRIE